jgi:hypothetical protein
MTAGYGDLVASDERGRLRAADTDRDRAAAMLGTAFSEGRLSKDEYDARLESALSARTYADLDHVVSDLPAAQATVPSPSAWPAGRNQWARDSQPRLWSRAVCLRASGDDPGDRVRPHGPQPDQAHR